MMQMSHVFCNNLHIDATKHKYYSQKIFFRSDKTNNRRILILSYLYNYLYLLIFVRYLAEQNHILRCNFINNIKKFKYQNNI